MADLGSSSWAPSVVGLGLPICPSAIVGAVGSIVINSINGGPGRAESHIGGKGFKTGFPTVANANPATSIALPRIDIGVSAALPHSAPEPIKARMGRSVRDISERRRITYKTTTGRSVTRTEMADSRLRLVPTNALAPPPNAILIGAYAFSDNRKTSEYMPGQIQLSHLSIVSNNARGINV